MASHTSNGVVIECIQGDITRQPDMDAITNAANAQLRTGGGVAGANHRAAGPGLEEECAPLAPILPGEAVISSAHNLPNKYVIHCLGPVYGHDKSEAELLAACYRNALTRAEERGRPRLPFRPFRQACSVIPWTRRPRSLSGQFWRRRPL